MSLLQRCNDVCATVYSNASQKYRYVFHGHSVGEFFPPPIFYTACQASDRKICTSSLRHRERTSLQQFTKTSRFKFNCGGGGTVVLS